ncbi:response regulator [Parabacteroides sp. 52]|uniref:response regulator n=1 Tax=unclassified Parabacteroides TaxID=2649774 RepID=UPI0013D76FF1|nr:MULTISPECIES: response regulator [unclassified Parabacteroides]MDH6533896.1 DNA-binding NtrC family response regulator [Parabacteroides sp. PM5-20]NDV54641.1 response regulator [Parabacteroides sp. 52]
MRTGKIIIVDDNETVLKTLRMILSREFKTVLTVEVPTLLPALLREEDVDVVLLDMNFGTGKQTGGEGMFWLDRIRRCHNPPEVVLMTAFADVELAVDSLKKGAADFIVKPWDNEKLIITVNAAREKRRNKIHMSISGTSGEGKNEQKATDAAHIIKQLIDFFLKKYVVAYGKPYPSLDQKARDKLASQLYAGNILIIEQSIERAILLNNGTELTADDFIFEEGKSVSSMALTLDDIEKQFIQTVLAEKKGNLTLAAQQLNITRQTLYNKLKKYNI